VNTTHLNPPISSLVRAALMVRDLERSSAFYRGLGLTEVYYEGALDSASSARTLHLPATTTLHCRILKRPDTANFGMVGLFEAGNPPLPETPQAASVSPRAGEVVLVFYVPDIDAALEKARRNAASLTAAPELFTMPHRSQYECLLRDPDGFLINLIERAPDEQFRTVSIS
jgi:catechol 2,3-dioxygenase-like lactoylglutathione lyase family enzyme